MIHNHKSPRRHSLICLALSLLLGSAWGGCVWANSQPDHAVSAGGDQRAAIARVLTADDKFGRERNQNCRTVSLDSSITKYVKAMKGINFESCPNSFAVAFVEHISAWQSSLPFFREHAHMRGEMHALFEDIRSLNEESKRDLEAIEKDIWGSWAKVDAASALDNPKLDNSKLDNSKLEISQPEAIH